MADISCMSFNVLSCGYDGFELPADRFPNVIRTIREQEPDLIGVQEACNLSCRNPEQKGCRGFDWCAPMIKAMDESGYDYSILRDQEGFRLERQNIACGLIIFYKKDRFELKESGCYGYPHDKNRYYQWVKLLDKKYERNVLFTNTHLSINPRVMGTPNGIAGEAYRAAEAAMLLNFWYQNCDENTVLFATGDYNSVPHSNTQQLLQSGPFKPSYAVALKCMDRGTTHLGKAPHIIDYCYVNPKAQTVAEYYPVTTRYEGNPAFAHNGYPSDHRALMTYCDYNPIVEKTEE